ncbi:MAG: hypothetical protein P4N59_25585 [Negativicutes bacterium]|nr:hypothetical protein [Negativicutes bacterium]
MNRWMVVLAVIIMMCCVSICAAEESQQPRNGNGVARDQVTTGLETFFGEWEFSRVIAYAHGNAGVSIARQSLGAPLTFAADRAYIFNKEMRPVYYFRTGSGEEYLTERYKIDFARLGIQSGNADIVKFGTKPIDNLRDYNTGILVIVNEDTLLTFIEGIWFELVRVH